MFLEKLTEFFYRWDVRIGVISSMTIQIILVLFGSKRKISNAIWLRILIWCAYMSADAVAIFSLGVLARSRGESSKEEPLQNQQLHLVWVPFLILHLGGPHTITAYSLEDNNLWLRHMLNLVIQIGVALYTVLKFWNNHNPLTYLVIPIFLSGVIRYCERIGALRSASIERISYRYFFNEMRVKHTYSYIVEVYRFQCVLIQYFADWLIETDKMVLDQGITILEKTSLEAFKLVKDELGLMYDSLYTKSLLIYSRLGICLRSVYLASSIATLTFFVITHVQEHQWSNYPLSDVLITYFLMIGAVILEVYATIWLVLSDWMLVCLDSRRTDLAKFLSPKIITCGRALFGGKRWSGRMKQWNILRFGAASMRSRDFRTLRMISNFQDLAATLLVPSFINMETLYAYLGKGVEVVFDRQTEYGSEQEARNKETSAFERRIPGEDDIVNGIKEEIFEVIVRRLGMYKKPPVENKEPTFVVVPAKAVGMSQFAEHLYNSVDNVFSERLSWSTSGTAFDEALVVWHIATTLCYYSDKRKGVLVQLADNVEAHRRQVGCYCNANSSRYISDYLMYLAFCGLKLLPAGNYVYMLGKCLDSDPIWRDIDYKDWRQDENNYFGGISEQLLQEAREPPYRKTTARKGMHLAVELDNLDVENKWKMIAEVWAHLLLYAAGFNTRWEEHAQQLRRGGEFITHVAALMAHASLSLVQVSETEADLETRSPDRESGAESCA